MEFLTDIPPVWLLVTALVILFGGFVHGTLGLGFPLVVTPILALFLDVRTAILLTLLPTAVVNLASMLHGEGRFDNIKTYWPLALACTAGGSIGAALIARNDPTPFQLLLALLIFVFLFSHRVTINKLSWLTTKPMTTMILVGLLGGTAAGTTNVMVPILIIYAFALGLEKNRSVQMFNLCFLCGKLAQMAIFGAMGTINLSLLLATIPYAVIGYGSLLIGKRIHDKLPTETFRRIVRQVLLVLGILLIVQVLIHNMAAPKPAAQAYNVLNSKLNG